MRFLPLLLLACLLSAPAVLPLAAQQRPLLIVTTDIGGDPDDMQSLRRLLLYSNDLEIAGLIASASGIVGEVGRAVTRPELIAAIVDDYAGVHDNLRRHDARYPAPESLRRVIRSGSPQRGVPNLGEGRSTGGSNHIIAVVDAATGPVHVAVWGGAHDLAQALWDVRARRTPQQLAAFVGRLRVYAIGDQDGARVEGVEQTGTGQWIRDNFPELRYLQAGLPSSPPLGALFRGMYQNDSAGGPHPVLPLVRPEVAPLVQLPWVTDNVLRGHGPLGAGYPVAGQNPATPRNTTGVKEGDSPSWLFVVPNGLSDPAQPEMGGWGGRFRRAAGNHYFDGEDEHWSGNPDPALRRKWTVARWREAYQNDFAARLDWCVRPFADANHAPVARIGGQGDRAILYRDAGVGERITLDAGASADPDGDRMRFRWWVYGEAGYGGPITLRGAEGPRLTLVVPAAAAGQSIHLVLELRDDGEPALTSYRRVVIRVADRGR